MKLPDVKPEQRVLDVIRGRLAQWEQATAQAEKDNIALVSNYRSMVAEYKQLLKACESQL